MKSVRRKAKVWVPAVVEHDGDELALVSIGIRVNGSTVDSKFWVNVADLESRDAGARRSPQDRDPR